MAKTGVARLQRISLSLSLDAHRGVLIGPSCGSNIMNTAENGRWRVGRKGLMETERMDGEERERIGEYFVYSIRFISMDILKSS